MAKPRLILPESMRGKQKSSPLDKTDVAASKQLLQLLQRGLNEGRWPSFVAEHEELGLPPDVALVYRMLGAARMRGYTTGLQGAKLAAQEQSKHEVDEDGSTNGAATALSVLQRIQALIDKAHPPGV